MAPESRISALGQRLMESTLLGASIPVGLGRGTDQLRLTPCISGSASIWSYSALLTTTLRSGMRRARPGSRADRFASRWCDVALVGVAGDVWRRG